AQPRREPLQVLRETQRFRVALMRDRCLHDHMPEHHVPEVLQAHLQEIHLIVKEDRIPDPRAGQAACHVIRSVEVTLTVARSSSTTIPVVTAGAGGRYANQDGIVTERSTLASARVLVLPGTSVSA